MQEILTKIRLDVNRHLFLKNPESSELGQNIVRQGVELIDAMGFEDFTFRKLGMAIHSTEASVYRYFESKQKLLLYLSAWYWGWMEYRLAMALSNIQSPVVRLEKALVLMTEELKGESEDAPLDIVKLGRIVTFESSKSFLVREVDAVNKEGAFGSYKQFVARVSAIITEISPEYKFPNMLVSTVIEGAHMQRYFALHLPGLTNKQRTADYITRFYTDLVFNTIKPKKA